MSDKTDTLSYLAKNFLNTNGKFAAFYDFADADTLGSTYFISGSGPYTGVLNNRVPAFSTGDYLATVLFGTGSSQAAAQAATESILNGKLDLTQSNLRILNDSIDYDNLSFIIDFEFKDEISNGVLVGCHKKYQELQFSTYTTGSKGFNFGVTDRGHLFFQAYSDGNKDFIRVFNEIELSKRNILSLSIDGSIIQVNHFDYLTQSSSNQSIIIDPLGLNNSYKLSYEDYFYIGGSELYYRSINPSIRTFSGYLNSFLLMNSRINSSTAYQLGKVSISQYVETPESSVNRNVLSGYNETIVYKTGITGYTAAIDGTLTIHTGRGVHTGSYALDGSDNVQEGEIYYKYYEFDHGGGKKTSYREELGYLNDASGYVYYPTGENAYDTLGLSDVSETISNYTFVSGIISETTTIPIYIQPQALVGTLNEISGISLTPVYYTNTEITPASSGYNLFGSTNDFKKNFIYYLGDRS